MNTPKPTLQARGFLLLVFVCFALLLAACGSAPQPEPEPDPQKVLSVTVSIGTTNLYVGTFHEASVNVVVEGGAPEAVVWSSSDPDKVTVDDAGNIVAFEAGTTVLTATSTFDASKSDSVELTVTSVLEHAKVLYFTGGPVGEVPSAYNGLYTASKLYGFDLDVVTNGTYTEGLFLDGYDIIFHYIRNTLPGDQQLKDLEEFLNYGGLLVYGHWYVQGEATSDFVEMLGAPFGASENYPSVTITDPEIARGLSSTTLTLTNVLAYGTFNVNHIAAPDSTVWAEYTADGSAAVVSGHGGQAVVIGFFEDALPPGDGERLFLNLFNKAARLAMVGR